MEEWKQIDGYDNYEVSTWGNVRNVKTGKLLKQQENHNGYLRVNLYKNGKSKHFGVHRLVAIAFIPNPYNKPTVNHIDEDKYNNHADNLEWATMREQNVHGTRIERSAKAIAKALSKRVRCVETGEVFDSIKQAERETGIPHGNISKVCQGKIKTAGGMHWEYIT